MAPKRAAAAKPSKKRKASEVEDEVGTEVENKNEVEEPRVQTKSEPAAKKRAVKKVVKPSSEPASKTVTATKAAPKAAAPKTAPALKKVASSKGPKKLPDINFAPTKKLHIYVFGENSQGELGLGSKNEPGKSVIDVKRPRLNPILDQLGVVQVAVGGMHCAALTADNKIYTWGVNDQGALGRETTQEGKMRDITVEANEDNSDSDEEDEDSGLNPSEAEPRQVDPKHFAEETKFASLFAGDSTTFALTTTGLVYGWGTFRGNDGVLGFSKGAKLQTEPFLIPQLTQVKTMAIGVNHALALTHKGKAFVWGAGEQSQLGRRVVARTATGALIPREFGFQRKNIVDIATGDYFSFAIEKNGNIYSWGHNGHGQTGVPIEDSIDDIVPTPTLVKSLKGLNIQSIVGGSNHSIARTKDGKVLIWGRLDNGASGMKSSDLPRDSVNWDPVSGRPRVTIEPLTVPGLASNFVTTGPDTCFTITEEGEAYSWGFSDNYQTGTGASEDVIEPTKIDNNAVRGKKIVFAGAGGQFGVIASEQDA